MVRILFFPLLLTSLLAAQGYEKRKKRYYGSSNQKTVVYSGPKALQQPAPATPRRNRSYYIGIATQYAQGSQMESTRLSSNLYRQQKEAIIYNELTFFLGIGSMSEDRIEIGLTMNKSFFPKDSTVNTEFEKGRSLDLAYSFIFESLYNPVDAYNIIPFFRIGLAIGQFDIKDEYQEYYAGESILATDYSATLGLYFQLSPSLESQAGYVITKREFQDIKEGSFVKETSHDTGGIGVGLSYRF